MSTRVTPGSGAILNPIFNENFQVSEIQVLDGGSGYASTDPPKINIVGSTPIFPGVFYPVINDEGSIMAIWNGSSYTSEDFTFPSLTTAVDGFDDAMAFQIQTTDPYTISTSNGTINLGNFNFEGTSIIPGFLTGRRPVRGQVFPRGVYNK